MSNVVNRGATSLCRRFGWRACSQTTCSNLSIVFNLTLSRIVLFKPTFPPAEIRSNDFTQTNFKILLRIEILIIFRNSTYQSITTVIMLVYNLQLYIDTSATYWQQISDYSKQTTKSEQLNYYFEPHPGSNKTTLILLMQCYSQQQ